MQNVDDLAVGFAVLVEKVGNDLSTCCGVCHSKSTRCLIDGVSGATGREGVRISSKDVERSQYIEVFIENILLSMHIRSCLLGYVEGRLDN
jgi:hypothetical protein